MELRGSGTALIYVIYTFSYPFTVEIIHLVPYSAIYRLYFSESVLKVGPVVTQSFFMAIKAVIRIGTFAFLISKMMLHFRFHHFPDCATKQILECIPDICSTLDIVLL